jgi:hypothetical protein
MMQVLGIDKNALYCPISLLADIPMSPPSKLDISTMSNTAPFSLSQERKRANFGFSSILCVWERVEEAEVLGLLVLKVSIYLNFEFNF